MMRKGWYLCLCTLFNILLVVSSCACVLSAQFGSSTSEVESVEAITCQDISQDGPVSVTQVFTDPEQVCAYVKVRLTEDLPQYGTIMPLPWLTFVDYTDGEGTERFSVLPQYLPSERLLVGGICRESPLAKGKHQWGIELGAIEIATIDFEVR